MLDYLKMGLTTFLAYIVAICISVLIICFRFKLLELLITLIDGIHWKIKENIKPRHREMEIIKQEILAFNEEKEEAKNDYITYIKRDEIKEKYRKLYDKLRSKRLPNEGIIREFVETYFSFDSLVKKWNQEFVYRELNRNMDIFNDIDGKSLDKQQRIAVVVDETNNLVLAGAGSGKTLTIAAKVKYLVDRKNIRPEEILLISFTRKASEEMYQRVSKKLNIDVEAKTFHKLGLDIITKSRKVRPDVSEELDSVIDLYFTNNIYNDKNQIHRIVTFFGYYLNIPRDLEEFNNLGECHDFYRDVDFETLKGKIERQKELKDEANRLKNSKETLQGETVKSLEELMIANFLFLNGINYIYEYRYPFESDDKYRKHYRPDFYLTDYDIYVEHFGITKDYRVPWLSEIEEQKYLDGIKWKRETHKKNSTILLETYSYYNKEGILLDKLEEKLRQLNVEFKEQDLKDIYIKVFSNTKDKYFIEFKKLISVFIGLFKSRGYSLDSFKELKREASKVENIFFRQRSNMFLEIVKPIFIEYQNFLESNGMIDFNDMISEATKIVKKGKMEFKYKYIIIDEYQDISMSRFKLIKEIKNKTGAKVMCVGDDWQSIYRFAGSDIDLFTNFGKYFGYYELLKIENTYRNSQELINIAGNFIMKNPKQLKKDLKSTKHHSNPIRMLTYDGQICSALIKAIDEIVYLFGEKSQITILGRNNFDINAIEDVDNPKNREFKLAKHGDQVLVKCRKYPKLDINFLTVHRSKGLEADNVIIINLENKLLGFPNKISDDPILSLVLTDLDSYDLAEERRLFYVALTRTKNTTYLIVPTIKQSTFCEELIKDFNVKCDSVSQQHPVTENPNCPRCQKGYLVVREKKQNNHKFLGCSNYPFCDYALNDIEILNNHIKCSVCGGYMVKRNGKYGEFYGCTNYPYCNNTLKIEGSHDKDYDIPFDNINKDKVKDDKRKLIELYLYDQNKQDEMLLERIENQKYIQEMDDCVYDSFLSMQEAYNEMAEYASEMYNKNSGLDYSNEKEE